MDIDSFLGARSFDECFAEYDREGYLIIENVLDQEQVDAIRGALQPYIDADITGRNDFEGLKSNRIYALLDKHPIFADLVSHPLALAFAERELGASCLLSACLAINLHPSESVQPWHFDDSHLEIPRPRAAYGVSTFWSIDETTETNGATEIIPGSHKWDDTNINGGDRLESFSDKDIKDVDDDPVARLDAIKATMPAGSFMVAKGTLWHRGGANKSDKSRLIVTPQYCPGWARQLENMTIAVRAENVAKLPKRAQELVGYSIHPPFMGYTDGVHPAKYIPG